MTSMIMTSFTVYLLSSDLCRSEEGLYEAADD